MDLQSYLKEHPKKHIIFDLDSTIIEMDMDWSTYRHDTWETVASFDEPLTQEVPYTHGMGMTLTNKAIAKHGQRAKDVIDPFVDVYEETHYHGYCPNPHLLRFIRDNSGRYFFYLWSSNARKTVMKVLEAEKLSGLFSKIVTRTDVMLLKPSLDGFDLIYNPSIPKSEYLLVGDSKFDEGAAQGAKIDFFRERYFLPK